MILKQKTLQLFPLPLVVIEDEIVHLHIFEPRYKKLIHDCFGDDEPFGIPAIFENKMQNSGAEMKVVEIQKKYKNGEMDIVCRAQSRFAILDFLIPVNKKTVSQAIVEDCEFLIDEDKELNLRLFDLLHEFYLLVDIDSSKLISKPFNIVDIYHKCGFKISQELEFADLPSVRARQKFMVEHLKLLVPILADVNRMKGLIKLNGHFKKLPQSF